MKRKQKNHKRHLPSGAKKGFPPGKPVYVGDPRTAPVAITVIDYDPEHFDQQTFANPQECFKYRDTPTTTWINIDGVHRTEVVEKIGVHFSINPLALEDIVNTKTRSKIDDFREYVFIVLKMLNYDREKRDMNMEQVSLIVGKNYVISFQQDPTDLFDGIRERLRDPDSRMRSFGTDYLAYCLMDRVVDEYFQIIEAMGDELAIMEDEVAANPSRELLARLNDLKSDSIYLRKSVWPLREVISYLLRNEVHLIRDEVLPYYRDLYDHIIQVIDTTETYRDLFSDIMDVYLSNLSLKMNEVMKVLTVISTIFIPLTFIVGVYGMNFHYMPELDWRFGYFAVWGFMVLVAGGMILYFRNRRWF
jgi:magnesium transporter